MSCLFALNSFANRSDLIDALSDDVVGRLSSAVAVRKSASLVVPGGTTPRPLFDGLAGRPVDWSRVEMTVSDEPWAPADPAIANESTVRARLLRGRARQAKFVSLRPQAASVTAAAAWAAEQVACMPRPFDVTLLGMDAQGQIAAHVFRGRPAGEPEHDQLVAPVRVESDVGASERLTLSLPALTASRYVVLLITGAAKLAALMRAAGGEPSPVRSLLKSRRGHTQVFWCP